MYFRDKYYFLSNMYPCKVIYNNKIFNSAETAFQYAKCYLDTDKDKFINIDGYTARKIGRRVSLRKDWNEVKVGIMYSILLSKFSDKELRDKLTAVEGEIAEDNGWGDTFWGRCNGRGRNELGKLLMRIRDGRAD